MTIPNVDLLLIFRMIQLVYQIKGLKFIMCNMVFERRLTRCCSMNPSLLKRCLMYAVNDIS